MSNIYLPEMHDSYSCHTHGKTYKQVYQKNKTDKYLLPNIREQNIA